MGHPYCCIVSKSQLCQCGWAKNAVTRRFVLFPKLGQATTVVVHQADRSMISLSIGAMLIEADPLTDIEVAESSQELMETDSPMDVTIGEDVQFILPSVKVPMLKSYTYSSPVPQLLAENRPDKINEPCVVGVDEAGRGPCLGPMVYAVSYYPISRHEEFKKLGFDDSKKLTEARRLELAKIIEENLDWIGWAVYVISPQDISKNMLCRPPFNLNEMAHDATYKLIRSVLDQKINVSEIYVDPVGPTQSYKEKLCRFFPGIDITVEPRADSLYPVVSAASICAKVTRDQILQNWIWTEQGLDEKISKQFGSGYPSDPNTVRWLTEHEDSFFGFPSLIRFSWKTISNRMNATHTVEWSEDEDEDPPTPRKRGSNALVKKESDKKEDAKQRHNHHQMSRLYKSYCLESLPSL